MAAACSHLDQIRDPANHDNGVRVNGDCLTLFGFSLAASTKMPDSTQIQPHNATTGRQRLSAARPTLCRITR